jgi:hypothetical protein
MLQHDNDVARFGRTNHRGHAEVFGIKRGDRRLHVYVVGKTGTGKSTLVATLVRQDLARGDGCALVDPHGDLFREIESRIPEERTRDVIHFDVTDPDLAFGFNPLAAVPIGRRTLAAAAFLDVFHRQWEDSWGPRLEHILRNAVLTLLDQPGATLPDILPLLSDKEFRRKCLTQVENPQVRQFWLEEYEKYPYNLRAQAIAPVQNKVGAFLANPILCRVLTHEQPIDLRQIMDERKVLLVNLAKGYIGGDGAALLGGLLVASMGWTAFGRADSPESERPDFFVYLDEFHSYATLALTTMLSELRKYGIGFVLAHQYLGQLDREIQDAVFGNVGTIISFRIGYRDAEVLVKELFPVFAVADLINLPNYSIYMKLMIDGVPSKPFSATTFGPAG